MSTILKVFLGLIIFFTPVLWIPFFILVAINLTMKCVFKVSGGLIGLVNDYCKFNNIGDKIKNAVDETRK